MFNIKTIFNVIMTEYLFLGNYVFVIFELCYDSIFSRISVFSYINKKELSMLKI